MSSMRTLLFALIAAIATNAGSANGADAVDTRIIGATVVQQPQSGSYVASLQTTDLNHLCGAAIISRRYVLTVAHCTATKIAVQLRVRVGSQNKYQPGVMHQVSQVRKHPQYDSYKRLNDLAVVRTATPIVYTAYVSAVTLSSYPAYGAVSTVVTGWGKVSKSQLSSGSDALRQLSTRTLTNSDCKQRYASQPQLAANIRDGNICTVAAAGSGSGVCGGDDGSPLTVNGELIGLVSWVMRDCASGKPDVYTRVATYKTWIQQNTWDN